MLAISIIALVVSGLTLPFTVWAAEAQTAIQQEQVTAAREQPQLQRSSHARRCNVRTEGEQLIVEARTQTEILGNR